MRPDAIITYLRATPFRPFRIVMNSGREHEIRHPEMARVTRGEVLVFFAETPSDPIDRVEMVSLLLIERAEHIEVPV